MKRKVLGLFFAAALIVMTSGEAKAQFGFGPCGFGGFGGIGGLGFGGGGFGANSLGPYASGRVPTPPYFAIHPPVYYGQVIHRAYGRSPYANLPSGLSYANTQVVARPQLVVNKHITGAANLGKADAKPKSQLVLNPFVDGNKSSQPGNSNSQMIVNPYFTPRNYVAGAK